MTAILDTTATESAIFIALRAFLITFLPDTIPVIQGQVNRAAEPNTPFFVVLTPIIRTRLATNITRYEDAVPTTGDSADGRKISAVSTEVIVQVDIHDDGNSDATGGDYAQIIMTIFRDSNAALWFQRAYPGIVPLHTDDSPKQIPFTNGEQQVENRWTFDLSLNVHPEVCVLQDFSDEAVIETITSVDTF